MEALRRLRRSSSETNVDRQLVTNVLLSFLLTARADPKRFEMLSLLATILSWSDTEREKAGLQRAQSNDANSSFWGRPSNILGSPTKGKSIELDKTDETEVVPPSNLLCHPPLLSFSPSPGYGWSSFSQKPTKARIRHTLIASRDHKQRPRNHLRGRIPLFRAVPPFHLVSVRLHQRDSGARDD